MKLKKIGKVYSIDKLTNTSNKKIIKIDSELVEVSDKIIDSVVNYYDGINPNSIYLRGSCLHKTLDSDTVHDLDIVFVYDDKWNSLLDSKKTHVQSFVRENNKIYYQPIKKKLNSLVKKYGIYTDISVLAESDVLSNISNYVKFFMHKVKGDGVDLSIDRISLQDLYENYYFYSRVNRRKELKKRIGNFKKYIYNNYIFSEPIIKERIVQNIFKTFFRQYSHKLFLKQKKYSNDLYYCYKILTEGYSEYNEYFKKFVDIFLNTNDFSDKQINIALYEMLFVMDEIDYIEGCWETE